MQSKWVSLDGIQQTSIALHLWNLSKIQQNFGYNVSDLYVSITDPLPDITWKLGIKYGGEGGPNSHLSQVLANFIDIDQVQALSLGPNYE